MKRRRPVRAKRPRLVAVSKSGGADMKSLAFLDAALHDQPPPSATSLGLFTTLNSVTRYAIPTISTGRTVFVFQWTPSGIRSMVFTIVAGVSGVPSTGVSREFQPFLDPGASATVPISMRPLRYSVRLRNYTVFTSLEGSVRVLRVNDPMDWTFKTSSTDLLPSDALSVSIQNLIVGHPHTKTYTARELADEHVFVMTPASHVGYNDWAACSTSVSSSETTPWAASQAALTSGADQNSLCTMFISCEATVAAQNYSFTVNCQDACRYPAVHVLSSLATHQPVGDAKTLHTVHAIANDAVARGVAPKGHEFNTSGFAQEVLAGIGGGQVIGKALATGMRYGARLFRAGRAAAPMLEEGAMLARPLLQLGI